jgi:hypothetical protein
MIGDAVDLRVKHGRTAGGGAGPLIDKGIELGIEERIEMGDVGGVVGGIGQRIVRGVDAERRVELCAD